MRDGRPSFTASAVALARGIGADPFAERLLGTPLALMLRTLRAASTRGRLGPPLVSVLTGGIVDHLELRTAEIDDAVRDAVRHGIPQVVLLGAGLDARAYRMSELGGAVVFELDHPVTQAYKRSRAAAFLPAAKAVHFVPVDFERDSLATALERAGHDAAVPTLWLWEGVTPYLAPEAIRTTLEALSARSARGSRLVMTYATPEMTTWPIGAGVVHAGFHLIGEQLRGLMSPATAASELHHAGFELVSDTAPADWARARRHPRPWALIVSERLAVASHD